MIKKFLTLNVSLQNTSTKSNFEARIIIRGMARKYKLDANLTCHHNTAIVLFTKEDLNTLFIQLCVGSINIYNMGRQ